MNIDQKHLGTVDGFDIDAYIVPDSDSDPSDADCYSADDIAAYRAGRWSYVGTTVTASRAGIVLGSAHLGGSEYGDLPGIDHWVSPLNGDGDDVINGYGPQMIAEAIAEATAAIIKINTPINQDQS